MTIQSAEEIARATYEAWRADDDRADLTVQWEMLRPQHRALYVRLVVAGQIRLCDHDRCPAKAADR